MTCGKCGATGISESATFCAACGFAVREAEAHFEYASFWRRFAAFWIDNSVITLPVLALMAYWYPVTAAEFLEADRHPFSIDPREWMSLWTRMAGVLPFAYLLLMLYRTAMNCSPWQGSWGKRLMKLRVVNGAHRPVALPQSALREACWMFSGVPLYLGFLWVFWEPRRRTFHDMLAGTFVIYDPAHRSEHGRPSVSPPPLPGIAPRVGPTGPPPIPVRVAQTQPPPIPESR